MPSEIKHPHAAAEFFAPDAATARTLELMHANDRFMLHAQSKSAALIDGIERQKQLLNALKKASLEGKNFEDLKRELAAAKPGHDEARLRTVFNVNLRTAYNAARYEQQMKSSKPFFRYVSAGDSRVRDEHAAWHGVVLPKDDAFWASNYPPNGFGCRCKVQAISAREAKALGAKRPPNAAPPSAGSSFASNPLQPDGGLLGVLAQKVRAMPAGNGYEHAMRRRAANALRNAAADVQEFNEAYGKIKPVFDEAFREFLKHGRPRISERDEKGRFKDWTFGAQIEKLKKSDYGKRIRKGRQVQIAEFEGLPVKLDGFNIMSHFHHFIDAADYALIPKILKDGIQKQNDSASKNPRKKFEMVMGKKYTLVMTRIDADNCWYIDSLRDDISDGKLRMPKYK